MAGLRMGWGSMLLAVTLVLVLLPRKAAAFGAGNIPSIAQVEGHNWRHGGECVLRLGQSTSTKSH